MPAPRRTQNNGTLYTLIFFVGLFIIAAVVAVVYYVKFEDQRKAADDSQSKLNEVLTPSEQRKGLGKIVGTIPRGKSGLGTTVDYLDEMVSIIVGGPLKDTSAKVKVDDANREVKETLALLAQEQTNIENTDPNASGLVRIIQKLKAKLDDTANKILALNAQLEQLHNRFDDFKAETHQKEGKLSAEKEEYKQQVDKIKQDYKELEALLNQTTEQQVSILRAQWQEERTLREDTHDELLKTQAQLATTKERIAYLQKRIQAIMSPPDSNVPAYKPDGSVMLVDSQIVHLNIGSDDRVYRGLTFSVYEKGMPIPKDGKGKAEIEVFDVGKNVSAARVTRSQARTPIVVDDIVANLIWDSEKTYVFVVVGEFDLNSDGEIDYDGVDKIRALIKKWGGRTIDAVSIETDFLVLGTQPQPPSTPTAEEIEVDPMAMEKYQAASKKLAHYKQITSQAKDLVIPVFNTERFLYFIGYKALAASAGAF